MKMLKSSVATVAVGATMSMGTVLLTSGAKGQRYALPHATIHMHPTSSGAKGYTEDVGIAYREQERMQNQIYRLIAQNTQLTVEKVDTLFRRDKFMNAVEAKEYGLVDELLGEAEFI